LAIYYFKEISTRFVLIVNENDAYLDYVQVVACGNKNERLLNYP